MDKKTCWFDYYEEQESARQSPPQLSGSSLVEWLRYLNAERKPDVGGNIQFSWRLRTTQLA